MAETVELKVHLNERDERQRQKATALFKHAVEDMLARCDGTLEGFSITTVSADGTTTRFLLPPQVPTNLMGEFVKRDIEREIGINDARGWPQPRKDDPDLA